MKFHKWATESVLISLNICETSYVLQAIWFRMIFLIFIQTSRTFTCVLFVLCYLAFQVFRFFSFLIVIVQATITNHCNINVQFCFLAICSPESYLISGVLDVPCLLYSMRYVSLSVECSSSNLFGVIIYIYYPGRIIHCLAYIMANMSPRFVENKFMNKLSLIIIVINNDNFYNRIDRNVFCNRFKI